MTAINDQHKLLFIHIPKNAGTSMYRILGPADSRFDWHSPAKTVRVHFHDWDSYCKFAIVRNPWDRMWSYYNFVKTRHEVGEFNDWLVTYDDSADRGFHIDNNKILGQTAEGDPVVSSARRPQTYYINDAHDQCIIDVVLRYENLEVDLRKLLVSRDPPLMVTEIPHVRKRADARHYREIYNDEGKKHIDKYFKTDIIEFGYSF